MGRRAAERKRLRLLQEEADRLDVHGFGGDIDGFRAFLGHKYGGAVRGWRSAFVPDRAGVGAVRFSDFCLGLKRVGYAGQALSLWKALSTNAGGAGAVTLAHLEPDLAEQLDALTRRVLDAYPGGMSAAWQDVARDHAGRANYSEFRTFLVDRQLLPAEPAVQVRRVFDALDLPGLGTITDKDLQFLDHWAHSRLGVALPPQAADPRDLPEKEPWSPPPTQKAPEPGLEEFRVFLRQKFGSPARAWRVALDVKGCGTLSISDFGKGCRSAGWRHNHRDLYRQLEDAGGGLATLRALDPETATAIDCIREALSTKHGGDLESLWLRALDPQDTGVVSRSEFVGLSGELGLSPQQAKLLFTVLDTAGTGWVAEGELGFLEGFESRLGATRFDATGADFNMTHRSTRTLSPLASARSSPTAAGMTRTQGSWSASVSSPAKSTRAVQARAFVTTHSVKHRWLAHTVEQRCLQQARVAMQEYHRTSRSEPRNYFDFSRPTNMRVKLLMDKKNKLPEEDLFDSDEEEDDEG